MAPPTAPLHLDVEAISGICGSISIACWVVVFSPQILENFRRSSADGLSLQFIIIWLAGDVFNILGAVLQGVLPTMIILAIYYTIADIVLLLQCFYYRGFTWRDEAVPPTPKPNKPRATRRGNEPNEHTTLLHSSDYDPGTVIHRHLQYRERRGSDWSNLSPVVPLHHDEPSSGLSPPTKLQTFLWNALAVVMVCAAGILGWFLSRRYYDDHGPDHDNDGNSGTDGLEFNTLGQVFGWFCAVLYLGSRLPQLLLNYRRKSTEGVSMLFFLFACLGNLTYVLAIFAYDPRCSRHGEQAGECDSGALYGRYMLVNASWLAGSLGTLFLDMGVFVQYFMYQKDDDEEDGDHADDHGVYDDEYAEEVDTRSINEDRWDQRPLLARGDSTYG